MIDRPDISTERILSVLQQSYSIPATSAEFLPLGLDSSAWAYRLGAGDDTYFLKLRKPGSPPTGMLLPLALKERGIKQVIVPIPTRAGQAWATRHELYFMLYPFVEAKRAMAAGMSDAQWAEFGATLKRIHSLKWDLKASGYPRLEKFSTARIEQVRNLNSRIESRAETDPLMKDLQVFWLENRTTIETVLERAESLAGTVARRGLEFVLCHGDIHTANILITEDGRLFIVDWDEAVMAPKERDLMFVMAEAREHHLDIFFRGYGETQVDAVALAHYRHDWCVQDLAAFAEEVLQDEKASEESRRNSLDWFKTLFESGSAIQTALATPIAD